MVTIFRMQATGAETLAFFPVSPQLARKRADHADAAHPPWVVIGHDVLGSERVDQRRLEPIRQRAQLPGCTMASGPTHDHDAAGLVDPADEFGDVGVVRGELGARLQGCYTGDAILRLRRDDILRQRQVGDATARVGSGDRLMNDTCRLRRRSDGFGVERDVTEQKIGLGRLDVVDAVQLARHVARQRQDGRVVAARLIESGDQMVTAGTGGAGTDCEATGQLGLAGRSECRSFRGGQRSTRFGCAGWRRQAG